MTHVPRRQNARRRRAYLAGPDVFEPHADMIGARKRAICAAYGLEGLYPLDNEVAADGLWPDREIHTGNLAMLRSADLGIFNLSPFRGPSADAGTVFELGYLAARGIPVFGYTSSLLSYRERVGGRFDHTIGRWIDLDGRIIEDFGNADNLMIDISLASTGGIMRGCIDNADATFEKCVAAAVAWLASSTRRLIA